MIRILTIALSLVLSLAWSTPATAQTLTFGVSEGFAPFSFNGPQGLTGFDVDVIDALCTAMGADYAIKPLPAPELVDALAQGMIDAAMTHRSPDRKAGGIALAQTQPYFRGGLRLLIPEGSTGLFTLDGLTGRTVGTELGSEAAFYLMDNLPGASVSQFTDIELAYEELLHGGLAAVFFNAQAVEHFAAHEGNGKALAVGPLYRPEDCGITLPQGSPWLARLNDGLTRARDKGKLDAVYRKWFGAPAEAQ